MDYGQALFTYTALLKLADLCTVLGVWYGAWFLRFHTQLIPITKGIPEIAHYSKASWLLVAVHTVIFHLIGAYRRDRIQFGMRSLKKTFQGSVLGILAFISVSYLLKNVSYSRAFLVLLPAFVFIAITLERLGFHLLWRYFQNRAIRKIQALIVGHGDLLSLFLRQIQNRRPYPIEFVGRLGPIAHDLDQMVPYLGDDAHLEDKLDALRPDQVILALPTQEASRYDDLLLKLGNFPVSVKVLPDFGKYNTFTYQASDECGIPLLMFNQIATNHSARTLKRLMDICISTAALLFLSPTLLAIAILSRLTSRGTALYSQQRIGANGHLFNCYKFRTMVTDAEKDTGPVWASLDDPRITRLGRFLRRTSLDELPQLYNVLRGDMSLVGPRPERPHFVDRFRREVPKYMLRHSMKSGLTGWAQVNGWRGNTSIEERIKCDLYYIGHWSLLFDLKILLLTFFKGFIHKNAY